MDMLDYVIDATTEYLAHMPKAQRKQLGQFFTSKETAVFMADLFNIPSGECISVLDPGAGSGILSAAIINRLLKEPTIKKIDLFCYENDPKILPLLTENLEWISSCSPAKIACHIYSENYILSQVSEYNHMLDADSAPPKYDIVIGNPPYRKIPKNSPEAAAMPDVCYGAPNLYFLFASMSLFNLKDEGEMVYIMPRSWTSGAYFKQFRQSFLGNCIIEQIHLFISRDKVFEEENVLQETMIIQAKKTKRKPSDIVITTTKSNSDFSDITMFCTSYSTVVSDKESFIYLVTSEDEAHALNSINKWKKTLPDIGLRMKTGLTVDFRNRSALRNTTGKDTVPLFFSQHIQNGQVIFPAGRTPEYIATSQAGLLQNNENYLFVKRFTSKEEPRRLQCGVYLARKYPEYKKISTQNKINFICGLRELSDCVVYGLYVIFNSTLYDRYYRILNGSTQVNSTEINLMPVPPMHTIESMGKDLLRSKDMSEETCDVILRSYL